MRNIRKVLLIMTLTLSMLTTQVCAFSNDAGSEISVNNQVRNELKQIIRFGKDVVLDLKSLNELSSFGKSKYKTKINNKNYYVTVFTSREDLQALIEIHNAQIPEGYSIEKIELFSECDIKDENNNNISNHPNHWDWIYRAIVSTVDRGTGWFFPNNPYRDDWWDGPDTATISQTNSHSATVSDKFGLSDSYISAEVGFNITSSYNVTLTSTTPVPADKILNVKTYITYRRVDFDVWEYHLFNDAHYYNTGSAYRPLGSYFAKFWYTK